jgi:small-conductance mechanosensitive channel
MQLSDLPLAAYHLQIIETVVVFLLISFLRKLSVRSIRRIGKKYNFQQERIYYTNKLISAGYFFLGAITTLFIWGVDQKELLVFLSSFVAILGVGLFAQWSLLSNITSSIILFVNHPVRVGDHITIVDKDFPISGTISNIGTFFITITTDDNELVTVPNSLFFQKMVNLGKMKRAEN